MNLKLNLVLFVCLGLTKYSLQAQAMMVHETIKIVAFQNPMTPLIILDHFARNHSEAAAFWGMSGKNYCVRYTDPETSLQHIITYDKHGNILKSENELDYQECPENIIEYCSRTYPNENANIWSYEDNKGDIKYFVKRKSKVIWFDKDGNYASKKRWIF